MSTSACPYCKEAVQPGATVCPHCQKGIGTAAMIGKVGQGLMGMGCLLMIGVPVLLFLFILVWYMLSGS